MAPFPSHIHLSRLVCFLSNPLGTDGERDRRIRKAVPYEIKNIIKYFIAMEAVRQKLLVWQADDGTAGLKGNFACPETRALTIHMPS